MAMHRVAVLAIDRVGSLGLAIPGQVFGIAHGLDKEPDALFGEPLYEVMICGENRGLTVMGVGQVELYRMTAPHTLGEARTADTIVVPCGRSEGSPSEAVLEVLRDAHDRGARIASICTGAFALAAAGLLDGKTATTHWTRTDRLAEQFPKAQVDADVLCVDNGDVLTAARAATGLDLCVHMVHKDFGAAVAAEVSRHMVIAPRRGADQTQSVVHVDPAPGSGSLEPTMRWIRDRIAEPITLGHIARHAAISPRTLNREFRKQTGTTPVQWLLMQRLRLAQELLETTSLSVEEIALDCGFGMAVNLRKHFVPNLGVTPTGYRAPYRAGPPTRPSSLGSADRR